MALGDTARLIASLELQDKFSKPIGSAQLSLGRFESSMGRMGRGVGQLGAGLATLGTRAALAAAGGLTAVVTTAASFEQAFTGVEKTVEGTDAQLAELEQTVRQMARTMPVSFEELSAIGEAGGALGIARDDLSDFIDIVARLSVSTNLSADAAATALGQLANVLGLGGDELHDFADSLVALGNAGASTESQIVEIAARFGAAGTAAGLSKEDILALASTTASMGIEVEAAGGSLSRLFNNVATNIGTSSAKADEFAKALGLSAGEFRDAWEKDALGTFNEFLEVLNTLDQFEAAALLKNVGITASRDINAVRTLAQGYSVLTDQIGISRGQTEELNEESQKFFDTTIGQWKILKNNVRDVGATIGLELLPITNELITEFVDFINLDTSQTGIKTFAKDLATSVRGFVDELRAADFSGFINTLQIIGNVGKKVVDIFLSLPPGIQAAIVTGAAINKLSGGLLGAGAGNIVGGAGSLFFDRFLARGSGPHNPVWVQSLGGVGGPGGGRGGPNIPFTPIPLATGLGIAALPVVLTGSEAGLGVQIDMLNFRLQQGQTIEAATAGVTLGAINALLADSSLQTGLTQEQLLALDALDGHMGDLVSATEDFAKIGDSVIKRVTGGSKAGPLTLPDTAFDPGGGVVTLPDTALAPLRTTAANTARLPAILDRQERTMQIVAARINETRAAIGYGFSELSGAVKNKNTVPKVTVNVTSNVTVSEIIRKTTSVQKSSGDTSGFR